MQPPQSAIGEGQKVTNRICERKASEGVLTISTVADLREGPDCWSMSVQVQTQSADGHTIWVPAMDTAQLCSISLTRNATVITCPLLTKPFGSMVTDGKYGVVVSTTILAGRHSPVPDAYTQSVASVHAAAAL